MYHIIKNSIKKKKYYVVGAIGILMMCLTHISAWAVPDILHYHGKLTDSAGIPLDGTYQITFSLFQQETGGTAIWQETQTVAITLGIFNVQLGLINPLSSDLFVDDIRSSNVIGGAGNETSRVGEVAGDSPAYDSGWVQRPSYDPDERVGSILELIHGIGGDINDYVVDLQIRGSSTGPINNDTIGGRFGTYLYSSGLDHWGLDCPYYLRGRNIPPIINPITEEGEFSVLSDGEVRSYVVECWKDTLIIDGYLDAYQECRDDCRNPQCQPCMDDWTCEPHLYGPDHYFRNVYKGLVIE
ncbi:MAG: hypothetical protein ACMUIP_14010 [bacterium]